MIPTDSITLTDSPAVVRLKAEFCRLDDEEQDFTIGQKHLAQLRERKAELAEEIRKEQQS